MSEYYHIAIIANVFQHGEGASSNQPSTAACAYDELMQAGHAVEVLSPAVYPELICADGQLNANFLRKFSAVFKPDYIATEGQSAAEILAEIKRLNPTAGTTEKPRHFVFLAYVGCNNFGDEFIFETVCQRIFDRYPNAWISCICWNPSQTLTTHGIAGCAQGATKHIDLLLNGASALIYLAGLMFDYPVLNYTTGRTELFDLPGGEIPGQCAYMLNAYMLNVPCVLLGIGAGPLKEYDSQALTRLGSLTQPLYIPRDIETEQLLLDAGVSQQLIKRKADIAFAAINPVKKAQPLSQNGEGSSSAGYITVALREFDTVTSDFFLRCAGLIDYIYEQYGFEIKFLNFDPADKRAHDHVISNMKHATHCGVVDTADHQRTVEVLAGARFTLGMRLHCSIISNACGVPSIGFNYNHKVHAYYKQMKSTDYLLNLSFNLSHGKAAVDALMANYQAQIEVISNVAAQNRRLANEAFELLWDVVENAPASYVKQHFYPSLPKSEQRAAAARDQVYASARAEVQQQISALEAENAQLRQRLNDLEGSTMLKVGKAATAPARALKRKLGK